MSQTEPRGKIYSPAADQITFYGRTRKTAVTKDSMGNTVPRRLTATGSSDLYDLMGDRMMPSMLDDMRSFEPGSIIFSNHAYSLPRNVIGRLFENPHIEAVRAVADSPFVKAGDEYLEMVFTFDCLPNNADAVQIYDYVHEYDVKIGTSVGVQITDWTVERDADGYPMGLLINHGILLEVSTVGIPCNFQSWVRSAVAGVQRQYGSPLPTDKPSELAYMARSWGDFEIDIDQLTLARINRSLTRKNEDFADFDPEDRVTLSNLKKVLNEAGLDIARLPVAA